MKTFHTFKKLKKKEASLMTAIYYDDIDAVRELISSGVDVNVETGDLIASSPLYLAALKDNEDVAVLLLEAGAVVDKYTVEFFFHMGRINIARVISKYLTTNI